MHRTVGSTIVGMDVETVMRAPTLTSTMHVTTILDREKSVLTEGRASSTTGPNLRYDLLLRSGIGCVCVS